MVNITLQLPTKPVTNKARSKGYDDCMTQYSRKPQDENAEIVEESPLEEGENPIAVFQSTSLETTITTKTPTIGELEESIVIAPGEGKKTISIFNIYCEEMTHPHIFPTGRFSYKVKRNVPSTPSKYFNQRLLNYSQIFAHAVKQKIQLNNQISIAIRKIASDNLNAGMLTKNCKATVHQFIAQDKAYSFMSSIKGTPAYWKKIYLRF